MTFGSLGDLHPYVAIALGLRARGHDVTVATGECYGRKIKALGLGFAAVRPNCDWVSDAKLMRRIMQPQRGLERIMREVLLPVLRQTYEDTLAAALCYSSWVHLPGRHSAGRRRAGEREKGAVPPFEMSVPASNKSYAAKAVAFTCSSTPINSSSCGDVKSRSGKSASKSEPMH